MAKTSVVQRNIKRMQIVERYADKRAELKSIIRNTSLGMKERFQAQSALASLPRDSSKTRIRNRCSLTGRGRGVYRLFGMSRICIRELAGEGKLPGVTKSSW